MKNKLISSEKTLIALLLYISTSIEPAIKYLMFFYIVYLIYEDYKENFIFHAKMRFSDIARFILIIMLLLVVLITL